MKQLVTEELKRWTKLFEEIDGCQPLENRFEDDRILIASPTPVPWHESLKPQYNEANNKIGYLFPQKRGIRLDIDFPSGTLTKEYIREMIDPNKQLLYSPPTEKATTTKTYWRFKSNDMFDTLTLVVRESDLGTIDINLPTIKQLFNEIIDNANGVSEKKQ
ncbi:hypothetical protein [Fredinandcohnia onubensis]|uniref:hypothetical protein n=1 Tax=Fredinandcohnia onubensis TaxID=1571209 RepID=UPI000C0BE4F5|nr:hypothetical protein [Fredinandcohnia onubensis]